MARKLRTRMAITAGRMASATSRIAGRGEGMVVGGRVMLKLAPDAIADLANGRVAALVSATNGKTSTTRLLANAVEQLGPVVTAATGANMTSGVVTTLASGPPDATAVLEVDEAYLPMVTAATKPRVILLGNLSRDQLDRMNEVAMTARKWRAMLAEHPEVTVVANADDPVVTFAAEQAPRVVWVGGGQVWTADSSVCPECGTLLTRTEHDWNCTGCGRKRPETSWELQWTDGVGTAVSRLGQELDLSGLQLPGRFNASNATLALAVAEQLGLGLEESVRRMCQVQAVSGRYAIVDVGALRIRLLLAKNPAGWTELIDVMPGAPTPVIVSINSNAADGRDPSWLWDVPFEKLRGRTVIATGDRRRDLAVRLLHAQVDHVVIADPYSPHAPLPPEARALEVIDNAATYTAFHELRTRAQREASND
ncbi:MAG TPA: DUF1727 domain-containing protein [Actinobacteria bacterium]|nr:DUF1727 domain-containing protein [Actinomycetota bacterium]